MNTRRQFLIKAPLGLAATIAACQSAGSLAEPARVPTPGATPGAPPAFNTAPAVGPEITTTTVAEAEKLMQVHMSDADREMTVGSWRTSMAPLLERRTGPKRIALEESLAPASRWFPDVSAEPTGEPFGRLRA
jgi:hypothetical protein